MKEEIKNLRTVYRRFQFIYKAMLSYSLECRKNAESKRWKEREINALIKR